tara:strand:+ start:4730 stop:6808 length:2079 start_codon:yes stop_codon:yes gene_type:complete
MTQSGYSFTPGKYDTTKQIDVVPEQEKSNARILASEEQFLEEMNARDDALVENTRKNWESLSNLSSKVSDFIKKKAEKDKKDKLQAGAALAVKIPASAEDIAALVAQEDGIKDAHLKISEIADRIEEETGSVELAEQFRNLSGWEQYAYVKASLARAAGDYQTFKDEKRLSPDTFITLKDGTKITYENANETQRNSLDSKIRHEFSEQFIGVNEKLLSAVVAPKVKEVDEAELKEARQANNTRAKEEIKNRELRAIETNIVNVTPDEAVKYVNFWVNKNKGTYGGPSNARLAFKDQVRKLVENGDIPLYVGQNLLKGVFYHDGDKKDVTLSKFKEFEGFEDELIEANTTYLSQKKDNDKYVVESNAAAIREELDSTNTVMTVQQKKDYLNKRREKYPDTPLNDDELSFLYGYKDDEVMRQELLIKAEAKGGVTEADLKHASPAIRKEFRDANLVKSEDGQTLSNLSQLTTDRRKRITDQVAIKAAATGSLDAKPLQYYSLLDAIEDEYILTYNSAIQAGLPPEVAHKQAEDHIVVKLGDGEWVDDAATYKPSTSTKEYETKLVNAKTSLDPENAGYVTRLLEAPKAQREELKRWAANGGKGQVPYYYRAIVKGTNILPRDLAWKQAAILGYDGQWDEKEEMNQFKIPKYMITLFLNNNPTKNGRKRFEHDVNNYNKEDTEEVHPYEELEDID